MDAQALQYARLDPFQQANYAIGRGASGLAGAIGGALGGQDPELQRITMRQQIAGQINPNDPASIEKGIVALQQGGDPQGAFMLQSEYRKMMESGALIGQREAAATASLAQAKREREPRAAPTTNDLTNARAIAAAEGPEGSPEYNAAFKAEYARLTAPKDAKGPAFGAEAERVSKVKFGKPFADLTSAEAAEVDKDLEARGLGKAKATAPTFVLPGQPVAPKDWMDFTTKILSGDPTMVRTSTIISDAPNAIDIIRSSTTNDISAAALPGALARLTGEGKNMSNQDVARFARTGGLDDRLVQDAVKFFTGRTTSVKKEQAEQFATSLYRGALLERKKKLSAEAEQFGYLESPNYKTALRQIDEQLNQINVLGAAPAPSAPASDLAAQAAAEIARRAAGKAK
jgi:hypothetical protein